CLEQPGSAEMALDDKCRLCCFDPISCVRGAAHGGFPSANRLFSTVGSDSFAGASHCCQIRLVDNLSAADEYGTFDGIDRFNVSLVDLCCRLADDRRPRRRRHLAAVVRAFVRSGTGRRRDRPCALRTNSEGLSIGGRALYLYGLDRNHAGDCRNSLRSCVEVAMAGMERDCRSRVLDRTVFPATARPRKRMVV